MLVALRKRLTRNVLGSFAGGLTAIPAQPISSINAKGIKKKIPVDPNHKIFLVKLIMCLLIIIIDYISPVRNQVVQVRKA
jgi:hypothetical protein